MMRLAAIQERDDYSCVQEDRFHFPKSRRYFLLEPRSVSLERNLPKPMILDFRRRKLVASRIRNPSRTTREGDHPKARQSAVKVFLDLSSSRACTTFLIDSLYYRLLFVIQSQFWGR